MQRGTFFPTGVVLFDDFVSIIQLSSGQVLVPIDQLHVSASAF